MFAGSDIWSQEGENRFAASRRNRKFRAVGALLEGHFVLTSGLHSSKYLQCALVLQDPARAEMFGRAIAAHFQDAQIQLVAAPANRRDHHRS